MSGEKSMMELDEFLKNYSNIGFHPYIVVNDNNPIPTEMDEDALEILSVGKDEVKKYLKEHNLKTQKNEWDEFSGYFIRCKRNSFGYVQTCFLTSQEGLEQRVQNIIVVEENANLDIFTGCLSNSHVKDNVHNAITDIFVGKNAKLTFNMIHSWGKTSRVFPKTRVYVEEGGTYISNYIVWEEVKEIVANPVVELGDGAKTILQTLSHIHAGSRIDLGGTVKLLGKNSSGEIHSSAVNSGGEFITKTAIEGIGDGSKGHIDCNALLLNKKALVTAIPELYSRNDKTQLTHEAFLGSISNDEIEYLQTKGFGRDEAEELIVKGFANKSIEKMPDTVREKMRNILDNAKLGF